jgi:hypothetical protein
VIAHQYVRATEDTDLLVPADADNVARLQSAFTRLQARVRLTRKAPGDAELAGAPHLRLDTAALKRLAGRPQDRVDLEQLERIHGPLP